MPEFCAEHTPGWSYLDEVCDEWLNANDADIQCHELHAFLRGYLECAEWLFMDWDDQDDSGNPSQEVPDDCLGFSESAIKRALDDCGSFMADNAEDLATYEETTGRDMSSAGHDYFLTRNRHGAGFWDRGRHDCLTRLTKAANADGSADLCMDDTRHLDWM